MLKQGSSLSFVSIPSGTAGDKSKRLRKASVTSGSLSGIYLYLPSKTVRQSGTSYYANLFYFKTVYHLTYLSIYCLSWILFSIKMLLMKHSWPELWGKWGERSLSKGLKGKVLLFPLAFVAATSPQKPSRGSKGREGNWWCFDSQNSITGAGLKM